jgi:hypothetical protein
MTKLDDNKYVDDDDIASPNAYKAYVDSIITNYLNKYYLNFKVIKVYYIITINLVLYTFYLL